LKARFPEVGKSRFSNLDPVFTEKTRKQFKRWREERIKRLMVKVKDYSHTVPCVRPDLTYLHHNRTEPTVTWIGHATFLLQHSGLNIVTDPVWASQMAFHKRLAPPGVSLDDMPPVDVVLISHSHYDHLSVTALRLLQGAKTLLVPAGLKSKLQLKGFMRVKELQWWETVQIRGVKFTFVPSQHSTRRTPWDMNRSHWGGWVVQPTAAHTTALHEMAAQQGSTVDAQMEAEESGRPVIPHAPIIYFAGDSGYFRGFHDIGRQFDIDVALMPIGAYEPEHFMCAQHVTPEQSLQAFLDTGADWFVPMHYGSFKLADDTPKEALDRLESGRETLGIEEKRVIMLPHGETWKLSGR
jgi:L-ascorbate metabolism protein UlaG (beta-lactamase superfamily)